MRTAVFIIGTNCTGKTTVARKLIQDYGGAVSYCNGITRTRDGVCFAGKYEGVKYGGVDGLNSTTILFDICKDLDNDDVVFEGSKLHGTGRNTSTCIMLAKRRFVVFLYAPAIVLQERLKNRSGGKINKSILNDQRQHLNAIVRWKQMGVKTYAFDTSKTDV